MGKYAIRGDDPFNPSEWSTNIECIYCQSSDMYFQHGRKGIHLVCDDCGAESPQDRPDRSICVNEHKMACDERQPLPGLPPNTEPKNAIAGTNLKVNRARALASKIVDDMPNDMRPNLREAIYISIQETLSRNQVAWTTEEERMAFGFQKRDNKGWTASELTDNKTKRRSRIDYDL